MLNKRKDSIMLFTGILLIIIGFLLSSFVDKYETLSRASSLIFCFGFGLIGSSLSMMYKIKQIEKVPGKSKQIEIEYNDERNEFIRNKAGTKAGNIANWLVIIVAYICIILGYPMWLTLLLLGIVPLKYLIQYMLMKKYNKEF